MRTVTDGRATELAPRAMSAEDDQQGMGSPRCDDIPLCEDEHEHDWFEFVMKGIGYSVAAYVLFEVLFDLIVGGLTTSSNRRITSFCDSIYACFRYRMLRPATTTSMIPGGGAIATRQRNESFYFIQSHQNSLLRTGAICASAIVLKFGTGSVVALALGETPVIIKGPRHITSFLLAFALMQAFPSDGLYRFVRGSSLAQTVLYGACALYKLRKVLFCVMHPECTLLHGAVLAWVSLEGNSILRRVESTRAGGNLLHEARAFVSQGVAGIRIWAVKQWWPGVVAIGLSTLVSSPAVEALWATLAAFLFLLYRFLRQINFKEPSFPQKVSPRHSYTYNAFNVRTMSFCVAVWACVVGTHYNPDFNEWYIRLRLFMTGDLEHYI